VFGTDSNSDHLSPYPTHRPATIDQPLNPRQTFPVGAGEHSFNKLSLNDDLKRLSEAGCEGPAALNRSQVLVGHAAGTQVIELGMLAAATAS
jgi:hypothetical protein